MPKKKTHIQKLFDQINGGDDVDAASEAQEIAEEMLKLHQAIQARILGEFDNPSLIKMGPLSPDILADVATWAGKAILIANGGK